MRCFDTIDSMVAIKTKHKMIVIAGYSTIVFVAGRGDDEMVYFLLLSNADAGQKSNYKVSVM